MRKIEFVFLELTVQPGVAVPPVMRQTDASLPVIPRRAGRIPIRKMEDSIFETNDRHQFESSLGKLTRKPGDYGTVNLATQTYITRTEDINEVPI